MASVRKRGPLGTLGVALADVGRFVRRRFFFVGETAFDIWYGVETRGIISPSELSLPGPASAHAVRYCSTYPLAFRRYLSSIDIPFEQYAFVDLGAGKGKALMLASTYPFRRVVGVELAPVLSATAAENIRRVRHMRRRSGEIELVTGDAAHYDFPEEPIVLYVHNPFDEVILAAVLAQMRQTLDRTPRPMYLIYHGPWQRQVPDSTEWLEQVRSFRKCVVYRATASTS
jgi:hypothetical protein